MTTIEAPNALVRAGCYCRISSDPQDKRQGTQRQREDTAIMCEVNRWTPVDYYVDDDKSASNGKDRPAWDRLLADMKAGLIDAVVVWNQDRGWRKVADLEDLRPLFASLGVKLATTNIGIIDFNNADDVFRAQVSTALSEMEIAKMKIRMKRAARQKAEQGKPKWRNAFGYMPETRHKEYDDGKREPDPMTAPLVEQAYAAVVAGTSISDIARLFNAAGAHGLNGQPWTASTVSLFLRSPRNAGIRVHTHVENGKTVTDVIGNGTSGTWTPLVDLPTWRAAQSVLNAPGRAPGRKTVRRHLLTGVLRCGKCGHHLSGMQTMTKTIAYRCKTSVTGTTGCGGVGIAAHHIEPLLYRVVGNRLAKSDAVDLIQAAISDPAEADRIRVELGTLYAELAQVGVERGQRLLNGQQAKIATDIIEADIATLEHRQRDGEMVAVFEGIRLGTPEAVDDVKSLSPERFRAVVDVLMAPVIKPVGKGGHVFDPDRLTENWRRPIAD
jgi:DNA invertase Pin-like site-specific DNA recombinase